ncbi:hypothetical protein L1987_10237 [Smallanthus sonchifolius]|uniref:Uncharacterized protein n=1 Tax=Smallanthus sonchifolius TaxID=185202 RepID=A0ACB9JRJ3_9ASTR|nr:hypothetical protein L1987_10237 [Smallanthus sonchifolius]
MLAGDLREQTPQSDEDGTLIDLVSDLDDSVGVPDVIDAVPWAGYEGRAIQCVWCNGEEVLKREEKRVDM